MELESFFIAEAAESISGRFFVFGGGVYHAKAAGFPALIPSLAVVVTILIQPDEAVGQHQFRLHSVAPDGNPFLTGVTRDFGPVPTSDDFPDQPAHHMFVINLSAISFHVPGIYSLVALVDDQELGRRTFLCS
jgi:hypothetical protein